jgi:hypothetical protein
MKFMVMHKVDQKSEAGLRPSPELIAAVGKLIGDAQKEGRFVDGAGLRPSATRVRVTYKDGKRKITKGPYPGENELIAGYALLKVKNMDEALEWAGTFAKLMGDVEMEIGPVTEPWDLGVMPKPEGEVPLRVLSMHKATPESESGKMPSPEFMAEMGKLVQEMIDAGVLVSANGLAPSSRGARLRRNPAGGYTVTDGPFAESKELISGFAILEFASKAEAIEFAKKYGDVVGPEEIDVREVH